MKLFKLHSATVVMAIAQTIVGAQSANQQVVSSNYMKPASVRKFSIEYVGKISEVPQDTKKLRVWFPIPQDSTAQKITDLTFSSAPKFGTEPKYGNRIAYWEIDSPKITQEITMRFNCERKEIVKIGRAHV